MMKIIVEKESLFSIPNLEPFTNNTFDTLSKDEKQLPDTSTTLLLTHLEAKDGNNCLFSSSSEDDSLLT